MNGMEKSDSVVVAVKSANKGTPVPAEPMEPRTEPKGNPGGQSARRTQCRESASQAADRIRQVVGRTNDSSSTLYSGAAPKGGAGCLNGHVRICAGGAGQPASLPQSRWRLAGAEAVLKLRALRASGDFDAYWEFHEAREYERNHAQHYADRTPPPVTEPSEPPSPPRLRRVK